MAKQRMMAGYTLQQNGILAPGEPIKCHVSIPQDAITRHIGIDAQGNFVLFAEVWSHPEGTKVNFREEEYLIAITNKPLAPGSWEYHSTIMAGPAVFHVFSKGKLEIVA
jgi:hypothetical protein